ncbi:ATP-binding protein [Pedobacter nutrimenti]|uniref:ATP-binding protein n=1 Tax=Pedobacter nutrimenti TaxID=1241337 RepID=UPI00292D1A4D|nr:ATP-binding protein [Pedobacter nutrimenti]
MLRQDQIATVLDAQQKSFLKKDSTLSREVLKQVPILSSFATIISGVRRCGKSTLLLQIIKDKYENALYFNFEDLRLVGFETTDLIRFQQEVEKRGVTVLFFDEIQLISKWEIFVHQLLREGYTVFISGSNASLLSKELGTHLTGRHVSMEMFPFSYTEYLTFKSETANPNSLRAYLQSGGFPEFVKTGAELILQSLMEDILVRDIAVRHSIREVESLKQLAVYLISNVGTLVSANKLTDLFGIKSSATILEYFAWLKNAYLIEFLPLFSYSLKVQARNPKKVYAIDTGLISATSTAFSENVGHKLENLIYLHLRRKSKELYYYKEKGECDFISFNKGKAQEAVQVCYQIDDNNFKREYNGLLEALKFFKLSEGTIVTLDQTDLFEEDGFVIKLIPAHEYLSQ